MQQEADIEVKTKSSMAKRGSKAGGKFKRVHEDKPVDPATFVPTKQKANSKGLSKSFKKISVTEAMAIKPKNLATTSKDRDDPLVARGFVMDGFAPLAPIAGRPTFKLDFSQYVTLVRTSYEAACRVDRGFGKYVSLGMYNYYATILLWQRVYAVLHARGEYMETSQRMSRICEHYRLQCPKDLELYLAGVGDFYDSDGREAFLDLCAELDSSIVVQGAKGSFGKVDATTHIFYETMPAPIISLLRLQADIKKTERVTTPARWNLPDELKPDDDPGAADEAPKPLLPNENLLGWAMCVKLTQEQQLGLEAAGVTSSTLGTITNVGGVPLNVELLLSISTSLGAAKQEIGIDISTNLRGSEAQATCLEVDPGDMYFKIKGTCSSRSARIVSRSQVSVGVVSAAGCFRYRMKRLVGSEIFPYCYLKDDDSAIPVGWSATEDLIWESVPDSWKIKRFTGPYSGGSESAIAVSTKIIERSG